MLDVFLFYFSFKLDGITITAEEEDTLLFKILLVQEKRNVNESLIESTVDLGILQILKN